MDTLVFLKLGGSLITDKSRPYTARVEKIRELAEQIARALRERPELRLLVGHGSGSFGHTAAREYHTREGIVRQSPDAARYWEGFAEVGYQARRLHRLVMDSLREAGTSAISLPPSAAAVARDGRVERWDLEPLQQALTAGLLPVIHGDVVFDRARGGTILSTEELFAHLAHLLRPQQILVAGLETGVWADFPARTRLVEQIEPGAFAGIRGVGPAVGADVTGGMAEKVRLLVELCAGLPGLTARIFSGEQPGNLLRALRGESVGTLIRG